MEYNLVKCLSYAEQESEFKTEPSKNVGRESESPTEECARSDTPSSDASTSGVCSMASSDYEVCGEEKQFEEEREIVINYLNRDILDLCNNVYPYGVFQTTSVPKMNMTNYWDRRSVYHRLGPWGTLDEFDREKCCDCDFYKTIPKKLVREYVAKTT
ncbi:UNVERIFIED_CONTAM: hypothetical protein PYX00_006450 [Menopon gallinae]|uniref:Uncharacterized protein n=1 Tax=Menopon gallinae TaxID=328185 RepID=A0AAW2HVB6_9NEOP